MLGHRSENTFGNWLHRTAFCVAAALLILTGAALGSAVTTTRVASGLSRPVYVTAPPGDTSRLFIVEQHTGRIKILNLTTNLINGAAFLDIDGLATGNEQGLLGLAFDPNYAANGFFYVNLTVSGRTTHIRRYKVSALNPDVADPGSATTIMTYSQPYSNHNGGWLGFGPDGFLYIAAGDGGSGNDPGNRAQDITNQKLGKMLRIDVHGDDFPGDSGRNYAIPGNNPFVGRTGDDEIWAYGLRNPWRASFDRVTGDLYIGDVGQNRREEIDFQPAASGGGENYGWRVMEGTRCNISGDALPCNDPSFTAPIHEYSHGGAPDGGFSVTGGYVYRGAIPELQGVYIFADYGTNQIWSFRYDGANKTEFTNRTSQFTPDVGSIGSISSFGEDACGNLYIVDLGGEVYRVVSRLAASPGSADNCNLHVDFTTFARFALAWLTRPGDARWNPNYDISDIIDGIINMLDADAFIDNWLAGSPPGRASDPSPFDGATGVDSTADLRWMPGFSASSHNVYFGTTSPPPFQRSEGAARFDPGQMAAFTKHYWRIDEVNAEGTNTGKEWSFTTRTAGR